MKYRNKNSTILMILCANLMQGCQMVESKNRVIYEDETPVTFAKVRQWSGSVTYNTYTNYLGEWGLTLAVGSKWELCIENPLDNYEEACYNGVLTVDSNGSLIK